MTMRRSPTPPALWYEVRREKGQDPSELQGSSDLRSASSSLTIIHVPDNPDV